jgi:hypothetical protein
MPKRSDRNGPDRVRQKALSFGRRNLSFEDVLTPAFLAANTPWGSVDELAAAGGLKGIDDLERQQDQFAELIAQNTEYRSFAELVAAAQREFARKGKGSR